MKTLLTIALALLLSMNTRAQYFVAPIPYLPYSYNTGTPLLVNLDDIWSPAIALPFSFNFYGTTYNSIVIGSNGVVSFNTNNANSYCPWSYTAICPNANIVSGSTGPYIFCPFHDIDPAVSGGINYITYGTAPNRVFVVNFYSVAMFSCTTSLATQQLVLYEGSNAIDVYIENKPLCSSWNSGNATLGIQNAAGNNGLTPPGRNTGQWTATNEAWRFSTQPIISTHYDLKVCSDSAILSASPFFSNYLWSTGETTQNIIVHIQGTYTVTASYNGNTVKDTINVHFTTPQMNLFLGQDTVLCSSPTFHIHADTGFSTYLWNTGAFADSIVVNHTGNYSVITQDTANCFYYDTIHVAINPNYFLNIGNDTAFCGIFPHTLNAGPLFNSYLWSTGDTTQSIQVDTAGLYSVSVTNNLCPQPATATVNVFFFPSPIANAGHDTLICNGSSVILNASGGMSYHWLYDAGLSNYSIPDPIANPTASTTYTVLAINTYHYLISDSVQCSSPDSVRVNLSPLPPAAQICVVTVDTVINKDLIIWEKPAIPGIDSIRIFRRYYSAQWAKIATMAANDTNVFIDYYADPSVTTLSYLVMDVDTCGNNGILNNSFEHSTILLSFTLNNPDDIQLNWTEYSGFGYNYSDDVIYRGTSLNNMVAIVTISSGIGVYDDYNIIPGNSYFYRVKALRTDTCYAGYPYTDYTSALSNIITVHGVGIPENVISNNFSVSPNPATDVIIVKNEGQTFDVNSIICITDVCGRQLLKLPMHDAKILVDVSTLSKGIYFLKAQTDNGSVVKKFVKE